MTVVLQDLVMLRGDSLPFLLTCTQTTPDGVTGPLDLTGATLWMTAKKRLTDPDSAAVFQIKTPTDIAIDADPTTGKAVITVPAAATVDLKFDEKTGRIDLHYDIQVKTSNGVVQTLRKGLLHVDIDVTQAVV